MNRLRNTSPRSHACAKVCFRRVVKPTYLTSGFQVIVTFPCTTHSYLTSCSRPCLFIPKSSTKLNQLPSISLLPLPPPSVDVARVPCCVLKPSSVVFHEIVFRFFGLTHSGNRWFFLVCPLPTLSYFYWPLHNCYPFIPPTMHCYHSRRSWTLGTPHFFLRVSDLHSLPFWFTFWFYLFGPRRRVLLQLPPHRCQWRRPHTGFYCVTADP